MGRVFDLKGKKHQVFHRCLILCLLRIKYWLLTALGEGFWCSCNHLHHVCTNGSAHLGIISQYGIPKGEIIAATQFASPRYAICYAM